MDNSLRALCDALKKIILQLKPQHHPLSFLLVTGKANQGKSTLLRQSHFEHYKVDAERCADIYFNQHGVMVELGESWLNQSNTLLQYTLKQLNRCHRSLKISGIILCVDINELLISEPVKFAENSKAHAHLLGRFGVSLNYRVDAAVLFTKLDALAGFCEFFQNDHASDLQKPLGFSLDWKHQQGKFLSNYASKFDSFIEVLGQQVIHKIHPARSSIKRTLIREFPLQLASLNKAIQSLVKSLSPQLVNLRAIYFSSGEQGGISTDCLNKKIQSEYTLTVQDKFPQSHNYRAYFIEGALSAFQTQTKHQTANTTVPRKWVIGLLSGTAAISLLWLGSLHLKSARILDEASKELLTYNTFSGQHFNAEAALYHLAKASNILDKITSNALFLPTVLQLQRQVKLHTKQNIQSNFLPSILAEIEQTVIDSKQSQGARYQALKIYLMLGEPRQFSQSAVINWFCNHWKSETPLANIEQKLALLKEALRQPLQPIDINRQIVSDVRNYLNALPASYLFYTLAKSNFPTEKEVINLEGFDLAEKELPIYYTKAGFKQIITELPAISRQLQAENWVLARQDLNDLPTILLQAYCYEYVAWWQNFMKRSNPVHFQDYLQARRLTQALHHGHAISALVNLIQKHTSPETQDALSTFNKEIASNFTELSLMSQSAVRTLSGTINELEKFLSALAVVNDQGKIAFSLAKSRFQGDALSNPLSALYANVRQLPEPISNWAKQIADDTWFIVINDCKNYINQQWQQTVMHDYQTTISRRFPFDASQTQDVALADFDRFFATRGILNTFVEQYLKPFLDTSQAQWQPKELDNYVLPISSEMINELIRANVITNMFFSPERTTSQIEFSLQKLNLDPIVANLQLLIGNTKLQDTQTSDSDTITRFHWPSSNARLTLKSIEGTQFEIDELGPWAFFKILQKVNVLVDEQDSTSLQILFEVNGNSGRYLLKTQNKVNPFIPGILNGFVLNDTLT